MLAGAPAACRHGRGQQLVPGQLRGQFWDRQHRIRQLIILADKDAVPWELLYPMDRGHDAGFLVEQFPVTRAIFGWWPGHTLRLEPARFVLLEGSLHEAAAEVEAMRRLLDPGQAPSAVISELTPLRDLIGSGKFGLLHFACHNTYEPVGGSSIRLGRVRFTPTLLEVAAIQKALRASAPTVFVNTCPRRHVRRRVPVRADDDQRTCLPSSRLLPADRTVSLLLAIDRSEYGSDEKAWYWRGHTRAEQHCTYDLVHDRARGA